MCNSAFIALRNIFALLVLVAGFGLPALATAARVSETYGRLPLHFEVNRGQAPADIRFLARGAGYGLYLNEREAVLVLARPNQDAEGIGGSTRRDAPAAATSVAVRMRLLDAASAPYINGLDELPGKANYFIGRDPKKWRTNVTTYAKVHYRAIYPGIDLVFYGNQRQLEYDFVVAPGADPLAIALGFEGAERIEIDAAGDLVLHTGAGAIRQRRPLIYQDIDGRRRTIEGSYVLRAANRVGFQVAAYDASRALVIDPVLAYSTYLGGGASEVAYAVAADLRGNAFIAGSTESTNFPTTPGALRSGGVAGVADAFVAKLNADGSALVYATYLGGSSHDVALGIAVDALGNAYVAGQTNSVDFPTSAGAFQPSFTGHPTELFVAKLDRNGSALMYSTYLGGSGFEQQARIAVDRSGHAYVAGTTSSSDFPTTPGAFRSHHAGGRTGPFDAFVTKLNRTGTGLDYSTFLGGAGDDVTTGLDVDSRGNAYVTGYTDSLDYPTTPGAFQPVHANDGNYFDVFITKLNPAGSGLVYSTFLGGSFVEGREGSGGDFSRAIAVDGHGSAYVTGVTGSPNFPTTPGAFQPAFAGGFSYLGDGPYDAFVAKLDNSGSKLLYSSYLGGRSGNDYGSAIAVDRHGNAYIAGETNSSDFPTASAIQGALGGPRGVGASDVFVAQVNRDGSQLVYSTYLGGAGTDVSFGIALAPLPTRGVFVVGGTASADFPTTPEAFQRTYGGGAYDAFVAKIVDGAPRPLAALPSIPPLPFGTR
jgi:hypothetical protein